MLYQFEKYYLRLVLYKIFLITSKLLSYALVRYLVIAVAFIVWISIVVMIIAYLFIGVNTFLEMIHLERFRIEEVPLFSTTVDLRPFFKK